MRFQLPAETDMDTWLTNLPDEDLQHLSDVTGQVATNNVQDLAALTHILALILHFCGKPALAVETMMDLFPQFALCLALEIMWRRGDATKEGKYSLAEGEETAQFALTEQGKANAPQE